MGSGKPPFRADQIGSLLRPAELKEAIEKHRRGEITDRARRRIEDRCIRSVVALQEETGIPVVTDGEFRRYEFHTPILTRIEGVELTGRTELRFRGEHGDVDYAPPVLEITAPLAHPREGLTVEDYRFTSALTDRTVKVCIPSPTYLYIRAGRAGIDKNLYPDRDALVAALAEVYNAELHALWEAGCDFVQIDDTNFAHMCDPKLCDRYRRIGEDPAELPGFFAQMINACIRNRPAGQRVGLHVCRGNVRGAWASEGDYGPVADALLNALEVDCLFLEYDTPRAGDFTPLRRLERDDKLIVLGLVTTKTGALETGDMLKRRIDEAARCAPMDRLGLSPQCGFAGVYQGNPIAEADQMAKLRLVVEVAREVWGDD